METLSSLKNPKVLAWRSLKEKKGRSEHRVFLVEGVRMVREALSSSFTVQALLLRDDFIPDFTKYMESVYEDLEVTAEPARTWQFRKFGTPPVVRPTKPPTSLMPAVTVALAEQSVKVAGTAVAPMKPPV